MVKDYTRYSFNGKTNLPKNRLVLEVIKKYVEDHPNISFEQLNIDFPKEIQGSLKIVELIQNINGDLSRRYFINKNQLIKLSDGKIIAVNSQWGYRNRKGTINIKDFINTAESFGYSIIREKSVVTEQVFNYNLDDNDLLPTEFNEKTTNEFLNLILYGPPGTGKTYNTINKALEIIDEYAPEDRKECEERFSELRKSGQIEFITFHQSYSYEDFVEGIKPDLSVENEQMKFRLNEGIFKKICATAEINSKLSSSDNQKYLFEDVWHNFIKNVDFSLDEEKEVPMKTTSFFIYDYNETTIRFRKKIGKSIHTLAFATLKKMFYEGKNDIISGGLEPYYSALLSQLMKVSGTINNDPHEPKNFVLIIDEINRGNISRIFGELITLIEEDKRDGKLTVKLPYSQEDFTVPSNLYIIGTMNTADRSIALLDIALRRRFTFFRFDPRTELVEFKKAREIMEKLNEEIVKSKGKDFQIGHSYFMKITNDEELETILKYKINPLLEEYFVNDPKRLEELKSLMDKKS